MRAAATRPWPYVAAIAIAAAIFRALALAGTDLYADEAYYWLWAQRPGLGYFDHPPLVAWLIAASSPLVPGELGVRLLFLVAGGLTVAFAALLARELAGDAGPAAADRAAIDGALLAAAAPLLSLLGGMALPDAPLAAAYTAGLWLLARARGARWALAGAAVGIALLAKYTAALLAPALLVLLPWDADLRRQLRGRWPWLGALVATALFAPCLWWNWRHGWASIRFQLGHGFGRNATLDTFLQFLGGQLVGAGPVALFAGVVALARARGVAWGRVAAGVLVPLAVTTWSATRGRVEVNWPSLTYPALAAAAAAWMASRPRLSRACAVGSAAITATLLAAFAVEQRHPRLLAGTPAIERFHGWPELAAQVRAMSAEACRAAGCDPAQPFLVTVSYQYASELAFYGGFRRLGPVLERPSQLDLWGDRPRPGEPVLFVGMEAAGPDARAALRAEREGTTSRGTIAYQGTRLRDVAVTAFPYARGVPRG